MQMNYILRIIFVFQPKTQNQFVQRMNCNTNSWIFVFSSNLTIAISLKMIIIRVVKNVNRNEISICEVIRTL